ncbi:MAG: adenylyltransferase/cytidyltransferase family protein [Eubacterium sp.]|nr:adenylyltransferase/cytidyltransferase family protein [Eubacterium sp.]
MKKVITYGTYDLLHYGHIRLLERAKALGDYLIVGVTSDDFDRTRGKINVQQSLTERVQAIRKTGLADEIIIEEYEGQKIDDIQKYGVDIFTVGSDWVGKFDYLKEYCEVVYLDRTEGVSSSDIRGKERNCRMGIYGNVDFIRKYLRESAYVNGLEISGLCTDSDEPDEDTVKAAKERNVPIVSGYSGLLDNSDAVYIVSHPSSHFKDVKMALEKGKHVLCEAPAALSLEEHKALMELAESKGLIFMEALKTAYSIAYSRLLLLIKTGAIGDVISVDVTCTSLSALKGRNGSLKGVWNSMTAWGPTGILPVLDILGTEYDSLEIVSKFAKDEENFDTFSRLSFRYPKAVATVKLGKGVKSEGDLVVTGTKGYLYIPSPWWKTDYFEIRYENPAQNKRYFYQLDGEGIRYEMVVFTKAIEGGRRPAFLKDAVTLKIAEIMEDFHEGRGVTRLG